LNKREKIWVFDSTLRDGAQARGITFSMSDRINMMRLLDEIGVDYIEAGNPASNPKERAFFEQVKASDLKNAKLTAFGSTRRKNMKAQDDPGILATLEADTPVVAIFGKTWDLHVTHVLNAKLEQNLEMVYDSIKFYKDRGLEVVFDAEHFFDGYKNNEEYAMKVLAAAVDAGADSLALCETNGGTLPWVVKAATQKVTDRFDTMCGIHCHNDGELGVANSLMAVEAGARQVQGTFLGFGERCGNACLTSLISTLQIKMQYDCIPEDSIKQLYTKAHEAAEIANITLDEKMPFVGRDAFAHKGGMHIDGINKIPKSFEHMDPTQVGNKRTILLSEVAGQQAIVSKLSKKYPELAKGAPETKALVAKLKDMEAKGYHFEGAESSFELLVQKYLGKFKPYFAIEHFKVIDEPALGEEQGAKAFAMVKVDVGGEKHMTAAEGNGPVNALDRALRKALLNFFPGLEDMHLSDYRVRVLESNQKTDAKIRVMIDSTDGQTSWTTLGVSSDVIEASLQAMTDALEYKLMIDNRGQEK
jgi:2-isopropylmalate synthase